MANKNEIMAVEYDTALGHIKLTAEDVKNYLVSGTSQVTDKEIKLFLELCKYQKLNPFTGEAYPIKFGNDFQMVVGYETYKRRAEENPAYRGRKSGIVVLRGEEVVLKEGTCLYPTEQLLGGWCRVYVQRQEFRDEMYKEVGLSGYQKTKDGRPTANWASKPATMIEKVAVSQALRAAFPTDYQGLYTAAEFGQEGKLTEEIVHADVTVVDEEAIIISQDQRKAFLEMATGFYGSKKGSAVVKYICNSFGLESTATMTVEQYEEAVETLKRGIEADKVKMKDQEGVSNEVNQEDQDA